MFRTNYFKMAAILSISMILMAPAQTILITGNLINEQTSGLPGGPIKNFESA